MEKILDERLKYCKSGYLELEKDSKNLLGISIGGGSPHCPTLYLVQVFENGPAFHSEILEPGDELTSVNGCSCRGWGRHDLAKYIQSIQGKINLGYNKFECNLENGKSTDIFLKKLKHRFVENVSFDTADSLGLSRAVISNDKMAKKLENLERTAKSLKCLQHCFSQNIVKLLDLRKVYKNIGDVFAEISCHHVNSSSNQSYGLIAESHRFFGTSTQKLVDEIKCIIDKMNTFITKIVPDTKLTLKKYLNAKFEYLSFCLKVKEMEEEDGDYLFDEGVAARLSSGNYDYRVQVRCRHLSKKFFLKSKNDLSQKMELLDQKKVHQIVELLQLYANANEKHYKSCKEKASTFDDFSIEISELFENIK